MVLSPSLSEHPFMVTTEFRDKKILGSRVSKYYKKGNAIVQKNSSETDFHFALQSALQRLLCLLIDHFCQVL